MPFDPAHLRALPVARFAKGAVPRLVPVAGEGGMAKARPDRRVPAGLFSDTIWARKLEEELPVMPSDKKVLMEKIQALPAERIAEIEDFVDFLASKPRRLEALDRLLAIAPALEAAGAPPLTEEEIDAEVKAVRAARRSRSAGADRP